MRADDFIGFRDDGAYDFGGASDVADQAGTLAGDHGGDIEVAAHFGGVVAFAFLAGAAAQLVLSPKPFSRLAVHQAAAGIGLRPDLPPRYVEDIAAKGIVAG